MLAPVARIPARLAAAQTPTDGCRARIASYGGEGEPPRIRELRASTPERLVQQLVDEVAVEADVPILALREVVENLVHADFADAVVSVLDEGRTVRVSDRGPGIPDKARALEPGFTTAGPRELRSVRGVGSGLPSAATLLTRSGGQLELADNLERGTVVTLVGGGLPTSPAAPADPCDDARHLLALLLELESADVETLAAELDLPLHWCGRELAVMEHHGLVARDAGGRRALTDTGTELLTSLF